MTLTDRPIRVLIVDDHALVREGISELLNHQSDITVIGLCANANDALEQVLTTGIEVALLDVRLPERSGLSLLEEFQSIAPEIRVIMISAYDDPDYVIEALKLGACGYLLKTVGGDELAEAIRTARNGSTVLDGSLAQKIARRARVSHSEKNGGLTQRETEVLEALSRGLANKQIAAELGVGIRTVEGHITDLFAKLGVSSRTEAALWALNSGLIKPGEKNGTGSF